jgi:hypothetical protein
MYTYKRRFLFVSAVANTHGHADDKAPRGDEMIVAPN